MRTIKVVKNPNSKSSRKILVNRSRSGNQHTPKFQLDQQAESISPQRNSIGLKSYYQKNTKPKQGWQPSYFNQDYYEMRGGQQGSKKTFQSSKNVGVSRAHGQAKVARQEQKIEIKQGVSWRSDQKTAQTSKISSSQGTKLENGGCEYFLRDCTSLSIKIKMLEKEKQCEKKKGVEEWGQVLKTEEEIQKNRMRHRRQAQLYEQIMENLKRQRKSRECLRLKEDKDSCLKNSGSMQTQEGESPNQY